MENEHRKYTEEEVKAIKRDIINKIVDKIKFTHKTIDEIAEEMLNET